MSKLATFRNSSRYSSSNSSNTTCEWRGTNRCTVLHTPTPPSSTTSLPPHHHFTPTTTTDPFGSMTADECSRSSSCSSNRIVPNNDDNDSSPQSDRVTLLERMVSSCI